MALAEILPYIYMLAMFAAGWRLFVVPWSQRIRIAAGAVLVCVPPLLFLMPALIHPERQFADLVRGIGVAMLLSGAICILAGAGCAYLRQRRNRT